MATVTTAPVAAPPTPADDLVELAATARARTREVLRNVSRRTRWDAGATDRRVVWTGVGQLAGITDALSTAANDSPRGGLRNRLAVWRARDAAATARWRGLEAREAAEATCADPRSPGWYAEGFDAGAALARA